MVTESRFNGINQLQLDDPVDVCPIIVEVTLLIVQLLS